LRAPWIDSRVDREQVPAYFALGYVPAPHTLHPGIMQVPAASVVTLDGTSLASPRRYWEVPEFAAANNGVSWPEAASRARELFIASVRKRLVSDVPIGVLLSGGLDSSAIVAAMAQEGAEIRTFTAGLSDSVSYDERDRAREVAAHFGAEHDEVDVTAD